jgi:hypothetical protein
VAVQPVGLGCVVRADPTMTESQIQIQIVKEIRRRGILPIHCPNEGYRTPSEAARLRAMGVSAGVPDLLLMTVPPIAMEIKTPRGKLTDRQVQWLEALESKGWRCFVVRSLEDAIRVLDKFT